MGAKRAMDGSLVLELANRFVGEFVAPPDSGGARPNARPTVQDCEAFLQRGIVAFQRIRLAEDVLRDADSRGLITLADSDVDQIDALYREWLGRQARAEEFVVRLGSNGSQPANLDAFRQVCDEARDAVEQREWARLAATSSPLEIEQ